MKITRIEVTDWGPHKHIECDVDSPIVGIIGANGSGKSNLLQAINYGITGNLNKRQGSSYIRNYGAKDGASCASVCLHFRNNGKEGSIYREVGPRSTKRKLVWDGKEYTKADDVKKIMRLIVGADEAALGNAVFILQGATADLVKGTPAERYEIFRKLMSLNFIDARSNDLLSKISAIEAGMKDYTGERAILVEQKENITSTLSGPCDVLAKWQDVPDLIPAATRLLDLYRRRETQQSIINEAQAEAIATQERYNAALHAESNPYGTDVYNASARVNDDLSDVILQYQAALTYQATKDSYDKAVEAAGEAKAALDAAEADLAKWPTKESLDEQMARCKDIQEKREYLEMCEATVATATKALDEANEALRAASEDNNEKDKACGRADRAYIDDIPLLKLSNQINDIKISVLKHGITGVCPCCGGPLHLREDDTIETLQEKIRNNEAKMDNITTTRIDAHLALEESTSNLVNARAKAAGATESFNNCTEELNNLRIDIRQKYGDDYKVAFDYVYEDIAALQKQLRNAEARLDAVNSAKGRVSATMAFVAKAKAALDSTDGSALQGTTLQELKERQDSLQAEYSTITDIINRLNGYADAKHREEARIQKAQDQIFDIVTKLSESEDRAAIANSAFVTEDRHTNSKDGLEAFLAWATDRKADVQTASTVIRQADEQIEKINTAIEEIDEKIQRNEKKLQLSALLAMLRNLTGKNGVPMAYMNSVFYGITTSVQELLERMGANFTVAPDPENPVTYRFTRTDNDSGYSMAQEQLSGGQAIRLALALLISAQQSILPDVGLLVLDEPSSHVDAEGVEQMRDMFRGLTAYLESADMQIIMVDHNDTLISAVDTAVRL